MNIELEDIERAFARWNQEYLKDPEAFEAMDKGKMSDNSYASRQALELWSHLINTKEGNTFER